MGWSGYAYFHPKLYNECNYLYAHAEKTVRVTWGKMPTLRMQAYILITNKWNSMKLIHGQTHIEFLIYRYFRHKIYDNIEITDFINFTQKGQKAHPLLNVLPNVLLIYEIMAVIFDHKWPSSRNRFHHHRNIGIWRMYHWRPKVDKI